MTNISLGTIEEIVGSDNLKKDELLSKHTTFKIGGPADIFVQATSVEVLSKLVKYLHSNNLPFYILGNGSNLLVSDAGFRGVIITLSEDFNDIVVDEEVITAGAGATMAKTGMIAYQHELTGFEFASGIPGSVGGGIIMNAGAYGGELKDITVSVTAMDYEGNVVTFTNEAMEFSYRNSYLKHKPYIVLEATFKLSKGNPEDIKATMDDLAFRRRDKQPLEYPSAGSTFKRPEGYFAGKLIQDSGLSGYTVGGAQVATRHNGFVINIGNATCNDVLTLIGDVKAKVLEKFGVELEPEVIVLGEN